jgi:acetoin utilization deacetylase AcuC-like enzyme
MNQIAVYLHPDSDAHRAPGPHPERPERTAAIAAALAAATPAPDSSSAAPLALIYPAAPTAEREWVLAAHGASHLDRLEAVCRAGGRSLDPDTYAAPGSLRAALRACGGAVDAVRRSLSGASPRSFVALRPPGHHAESDAAMGFCLLNQVAVAARWLCGPGGLSRVAIVDFDVHHGNGTQQIFWRDGRVLYASLHQSPLYPGSGGADERGAGAGLGTTLNCPLPPGSSGGAWLGALERQVLPALERHRPEFLLLSAGFDGHREDPLSGTCLEDEDYSALTAQLVAAAEELCGGRVVSVLEGGYHLPALGRCALGHVRALAGGSRSGAPSADDRP